MGSYTSRLRSHVFGYANSESSREHVSDPLVNMVQRIEDEWLQQIASLNMGNDQSGDAWIAEQLQNLDMIWSEVVQTDIQSLKEEAASEKALVLNRLSQQGPPSRFRLIDCKSTCQQGCVILVNGRHHQAHYTAISHTWGQAVYDVFDCQCVCICLGDVPARSSVNKICPGAVARHAKEHQQVVTDILKMCERLMQAGTEFVWHDGVCIAQHDNAEVEETIRHMGWIYANAFDTVIFLDYIGNPIPLLDPRVKPEEDGPVRVHTRWNTRVWTLQEAVLSKRRRYCIGWVDTREVAVDASMSYAQNWVGFISKLACACHDSRIAVIEEEAFWEQVLSLLGDIIVLQKQMLSANPGNVVRGRYNFRLLAKMMLTICSWIALMKEDFFCFPSLSKVLKQCALYRDSKWQGDRINSVLGLAGITDFVAPKDGNLQASTIEFLKRLGQQELGEALFWVNVEDLPAMADGSTAHTRVTCLSRPFSSLCMHLRKGNRTVGLSCSPEGAPYIDELLRKEWPEEPHAELCLSFLEGFTPEKDWPFSSPLLHLARDEPTWSGSSASEDVVKYKVLENGMLELKGTLLSIPVRFDIVGTAPVTDVPERHIDSNSLAVGLLVGLSVCPRFGAFMNFPTSMLLGVVMISLRADPQSCCTRPVVQGKVMKEGDSFPAHLVLAEFHPRERLGRLRPLLIVSSVNGPSELDHLQSPVCRLGFMLAADNLIRLIRLRHAHCFTRVLNRLVVR